MKFLLDTNAWVALLRDTSPMLTAAVANHAASQILICPVVVAELWYGVFRSATPYRALNEANVRQLLASYGSAPFDDRAAMDSGAFRAELSALGCVIGSYDLLIAAIARSQGLTLVTHHTAEFSRVTGLLIEDWQGP